LKHWWEQWPGRLEHELEALTAAGIPFTIDEGARTNGAIKIDLHPIIDGEQLNLQAIFPDLYPYFQVEVLAPDLALDHHQNPFARNLCLIGRSSSNWRTTDTLADLIRVQLPVALKAGRADTPEISGAIEEHQGEPLSAYFDYPSEAVLMVDSSWSLPPESTHGELVIRLEDQAEPILRGVVVEVRASGGEILARADSALSNCYPHCIHGKWFRVKRLVPQIDPRKFLEGYVREHQNITNFVGAPVSGWKMSVTGLVFPEELAYREKGDGWIFVVRAQRQKRGNKIERFVHFVRAGRAGKFDLGSRIPELIALPKKRVAVIGLGCMGAPSALEFARSGVGEIRILDCDIVEPGTVVRWPLGIPAAGLSKASTLKTFIASQYPYTKVTSWHHRIGSAFKGNQSDLDVLRELLADIDLIYDATAEIGLQHLLSDIAAEKNQLYVCVSTTPGAWGGLVSRIVPRQTKGCWFCLQRHLRDSSIPSPPNNPTGGFQPRGCIDPTFTGASFDIGQIALAGVRLAVATLSQGTQAGYPDFDWDIGVIALRDTNGKAIAPHWKTFPLTQHPECTCGNS